MASTIIPMHAKTVVVQTNLSISEVIQRMDAAVHKSASLDIMQKLSNVDDQDQLVKSVNEVTEGNDFLYFSQFSHHRLLSIHDGPGSRKPPLFLYTIGNPLIAQRIIRLNPLAASHIPLRILIAERHPENEDYAAPSYDCKVHQHCNPMNHPNANPGQHGPDHTNTAKCAGTVVSYTLPSSVMLQSPFAMGVGLMPDKTDLCQLRKEVFALDEKIERLVRRITSVEPNGGGSGGEKGNLNLNLNGVANGMGNASGMMISRV
ncbi:hypothetical protein BJ165DRAFT_1425858 [Panaeolus papilionaceus]|nr:hypothetical protein BJ165DRAFT_1425858 [Panaeolus papilionaceus]